MNLTREYIDNCNKKYLLKDKPKQSDVFIIEFQSKKLVVKDYRYKKGLVKLYGRWFNWREVTNYKFLNDKQIKFVPKCYGRIDKYAFAMEYVDSITINECKNNENQICVTELMAKYLKVLHKLRFFHVDLRKRGNVLVKGNEIVFIDFASSIKFSKFNPFYYLLKDILTFIDNSAVVKWKAYICPSRITKKDYQQLKLFERMRSLWIFNKPRKASDYSEFKDRK